MDINTANLANIKFAYDNAVIYLQGTIERKKYLENNASNFINLSLTILTALIGVFIKNNKSIINHYELLIPMILLIISFAIAISLCFKILTPKNTYYFCGNLPEHILKDEILCLDEKEVLYQETENYKGEIKVNNKNNEYNSGLLNKARLTVYWSIISTFILWVILKLLFKH
jgi:trans-2-enoyl-CoA reductase